MLAILQTSLRTGRKISHLLPACQHAPISDSVVGTAGRGLDVVEHVSIVGDISYIFPRHVLVLFGILVMARWVVSRLSGVSIYPGLSTISPSGTPLLSMNARVGPSDVEINLWGNQSCP